jgi:RNA polymerase sigma-70 factor (ECF subfamily)
MSAQKQGEGLARSERVLAEIYAASGASNYDISPAEFSDILLAVAKKYGAAAETDFFLGLKLEDLAIARGCAKGNEKAWEVFLTKYREKLFDSARQITREESSARELADSIYAALYCKAAQYGVRFSKLSSYTGRGSFEGWLLTVLAQEWINRYRKQKRMVSLDEQVEEGVQFAAAEKTDSDEIKSPVILATDAVLAEIPAEDRYILAAYFLDKRTLAEVAQTLGVHESTISRRVEKLVTSVRKQIVERLVRGGMSKRQAEEAMELDVRDMEIDVGAALGRGKSAFPANLSGEMVQDAAKKAFQAIEGKKE